MCTCYDVYKKSMIDHLCQNVPSKVFLSNQFSVDKSFQCLYMYIDKIIVFKTFTEKISGKPRLTVATRIIDSVYQYNGLLEN